MGSCTRRHFLLSICLLQLLTIIERQVFDFLGYMWAPILANFFHIIFVIFGFFGAYQFRAKYIITYSIWNFLWIGWNVFIICFYLSVGILDKNSDILNLGTGSVSWFEVNGYGCKPNYATNITSEDPFRPQRPESVTDCLLDYSHIEIIHAAIQLFFAVLGLIGAICIAKIFLEDDDRSSRDSKSKSKRRQSLYSIEFSPPVDAIRGRGDDLIDYENENDGRGPSLSPKPMTPRRVKRRSVMTRGTTNRQSTTSRRSHSSGNRSSHRASRRKYQQNPVTKLIDQQQGTVNKGYTSTFQRLENPSLTETNLKYLNKDMAMGSIRSFTKPNNIQHFTQNIPPDPIYYNMSQSTTHLNHQLHHHHQQQQQLKPPPQPPTVYSNNSTLNNNIITTHQGGHYNPTYHHSNTNLTNSPESPDDLYNNRPPSVRSSYSNFHGARHLTSYNSVPAPTENVFAVLGNQQQQQQVQAIPQVPQRRTASRESVRSMAFLNNGPPAYNLNYHTPPDSETTM